MARRVLWSSLKYALALGLLAYVVYANWDPTDGRGLQHVWQAHVVERQPIDAPALLLCFVLFTASLLLLCVRWHVLMRAQDLPVAWPTTLRIGIVGHFFNTFLPGSVGGDLVKAAAVARTHERRATAVATVIMDRVLGLWSLIAFAALVGCIAITAGMLEGTGSRPARAIVTAASGIAGVTLVGWLLMGTLLRRRTTDLAGRLRRIPKVGGTLAELGQVTAMYRRRPWSLALAVGLSWVSHAAYAVAFYCGARTLWDGGASGPLPTIAEHFLLVPLGCIIAAIPLFPGGAGINEAGFGGLYALFGAAASNGVLAALVSRLASWVIGLVGYVVCQATQWSSQRESSSVPNAAITTGTSP
jgi:uncharacterized protein (TIRG00374 family)